MKVLHLSYKHFTSYKLFFSNKSIKYDDNNYFNESCSILAFPKGHMQNICIDRAISERQSLFLDFDLLYELIAAL